MTRHIRRTGAALLLASIAAALPACSHGPQKQTPVLQIGLNEPQRMGKATEDGDYVLYAVGDNHPIKTVSLKTGEDLGFNREGDRVIAIAGAGEKSLPNGAYVWKRK